MFSIKTALDLATSQLFDHCPSRLTRLTPNDIDGFTRPGQRLHHELWKDPPCYFYGKIHYFDWAIFNSYILVITKGYKI
jgi:hypothetical protein